MSFQDSFHGFRRECYGFQGSVGLLICEYQNFCSLLKKIKIFDNDLADLFHYGLICLFNLMVKICDRFEICFP